MSHQEYNKTIKDKLKKITSLVKESHDSFQDNRQRFIQFRNYIYKSTVTNEKAQMLNSINSPVIEANLIQAYISRLISEFLKNEPSIIVSKGDGAIIPNETLNIIEDFIRHKFDECNKDFVFYNAYKDSLSGGYSVLKVYVDYENEYSFKKTFRIEKCNPLYCGFDQKASLQTKSDGDFCFEIFIIDEETFKEMYPDINTDNLIKNGSIGGFKWSFATQSHKKFFLVCDFYEKKKKSIMLYQLSNGETLTQKEYNKLQKIWDENLIIDQIPKIIKKRRSLENVICRTRYINETELEYDETDYKYFPLIFVDGDSTTLQQNTDGSSYQMTKPYASAAKGAQDIKNYAMQCIANHMENHRVNNLVIKSEALPKEQDLINNILNPQTASVLVVNAYSEDSPDKPIPDPIFNLPPNQLPGEIMAMYQQADITIQSILGGFGSNIGNDDIDLSGNAIVEMASLGNASAMPYVEGMLAAMTQVAVFMVDAFPKYIVEEREIPLMNSKGVNDYFVITSENMNMFNYRNKEIKVVVTAGANFNIQKRQSLKQISSLMSASPEFSNFINSVGLEVLIKNMTIHSQNELMEKIPEYNKMKQINQQQEQEQQQKAMMMDPRIIQSQIDQQKLELEKSKIEMDNQIKIAQLSIQKIIADAKLIESESKVSQSQIDSVVRLEQSETSRIDHSLDASVKLAEIHARQNSQQNGDNHE